MKEITYAELDAKYPTPEPTARDRRIIDTAHRLVHLYLGPDLEPGGFEKYIRRGCKNARLNAADTRAVIDLAYTINFA